MSSDGNDAMDIVATAPNGVHESPKSTKRSCNNCRQQKLKCDVVQSPFKACSRCRRLQKECKVEGGFRRIGQRDKYAEMQHEINDLRRQLQAATQSQASGRAVPVPAIPEESPQTVTKSRQLGDVELSGKTVDSLYREYLAHYHPYLPFLDSEASPDEYFDRSLILGWTIIIIAARRFHHEPPLLGILGNNYKKLLWSTISEGPQAYHVVKALCLICTWPLPITTNPSDTTFPLSSMMMSIALQNILDFPLHLQFPKGKVTEAEQRDRRVTWAACNIVAQCTASAYGFPTQANFDQLQESNFESLSPPHIHKDLLDQLRIAQLYKTLGKTLYENVSDPSRVPLIDERSATYNHARTLYEDVANSLGPDVSMNTELMLLAANIHVDVFSLFLPATSTTRKAALLNLYNAACTCIRRVMDFETATGTLLEYCTNILIQSLISAVFALVKLLYSSFATSISVENGKTLVNAAILAIRRMSLRSDDVCARMATWIPQAAKDLSLGGFWASADPLELKIRERMCASHTYDCMWHWLFARRQEAQNRVAASSQSASQEGGQLVQAGPDLNQQVTLPNLAPDLIGDGLDFFNMDWLLGDFANVSYDFEHQTI